MTIELALLCRLRYHGLEITGSRLGGLLALLAGDLRTGSSSGGLVAALWPDEQPEHPAKALQVLVSRARARLGADVIVNTPTGYRLALREDQIDASAIQLYAAASEERSRAGDHAVALEQAEKGLALCEGADSWDNGGDDPLSALRVARVPTYRSLNRERALALSRLGRRPEAVEPLKQAIRERPRDEAVLVELLRCEAATEGTAAALARYDAYRRALRDELGSDPGAALRAGYQELLLSDAPVIRQGVRHEPNPLLGRDGDVAAVAELLRTGRVTSIIGPGGLGKTRLAHVVSRLAEQRVVYFVGLAGATEDDDVAAEVAAVLGVGDTRHRPAGRSDVVAGIAGALGPGPALLVLDNCEHVVHGAAELVRALVSSSEHVRVLTTSRAPLGLSSESVYPLPELDLATTVELFCQRARAARPGVSLPADVVRELCGHLDGLPLAAELAAARIRVMSVTEIARRLDDRFGVLRGGTRDAPQRHRTLHAVIDWSWHLLEPAGQAALRTLSVFPDGFTSDAVRHVLGGADIVEQLVDQSLLKVVDTVSGTRFRMLETVREFSAAHREQAGETKLVIDRFLAWARDFGVAHHGLLLGPELASWFEPIRAEQDNLVLALRHGLDRRDGATVAATSAVLYGLWIIDSNLPRMASSGDEIAWTLSHFRPEPELVEVTRAAAAMCALSGFLLRAPGVARCLLALRRLPIAAPDTVIRASHVVLGTLGESDLSALYVLCDSGEPLLAAMACIAVSYACEAAGDMDGALKAARRMLTALESQDVKWFRTLAHSRISELCLEIGPVDEVLRHGAAALELLEEFGAWSSANRIRWVMVYVNMRRGAYDEASAWLERTEHSAEPGQSVFEINGMSMFETAVSAEVTLGRGDADTGLRLWRRVADQLRHQECEPANRRDLSGMTPWTLEVQAVTVIAHAQHGRLDLVTEIIDALPATLSTMVNTPTDRTDSFPVCGALLLALAMVDIDAGATASGARMIALAERFDFVRGFQPTMSVDRLRRIAEDADKSAYVDAVSSYADLDRPDLRAAAAVALLARDQLSGSGPA